MKKLILMLSCLSIVSMSQDIKPIRAWKTKRAEYRMDRVAISNDANVKQLSKYTFPGWKYKEHIVYGEIVSKNDRLVLWNGTPHRVILYNIVYIVSYRPIKKR